MSLFGGICALVMLAAKRKPKRFHGYIYFETGSGWGGFEGGPFFFVNSEPRISLLEVFHPFIGNGIFPDVAIR